MRRFYSKGFEETDTHRRWAGLWQKQFKARLHDETFISLNKLRPRFSFQSLRRYSVRFAPLNLYMSAIVPSNLFIQIKVVDGAGNPVSGTGASYGR